MKSGSHVFLFILACTTVGFSLGIVLAYAFPEKSQPINHSIGQATPPTSVATTNATVTATATVLSATSATTSGTSENAKTAVKDNPSAPCATPVDPTHNPNLWLAPVGPDYMIGNYIPSELIPLDKYVETTNPNICLTQTAAVALKAMERAMHAEKLYPIVSSGFRDVSYQENLYEGTNVITNGYSSVALPGHSEHQLGYTIDFIATPDETNTDYYSLDNFKNTLSYAWLAQNSWKYGFIQSYQVGEEAITGYIAEPWHFRYVGIDNALAIHDSGTTTYQYLQNLEKTSQ